MVSSISGFVFTGGKSSRFGSNKLFHLIDDRPMGLVVFNNLAPSINGSVVFVGPPMQSPDFSKFTSFEGKREGQGPLGAMCDVLETALTDFVVFTPCDTPYFRAVDFGRLIENKADQDVVVAADSQPPHLRHWLLSCWNVEATRDHMIGAFSSGERAIHRAVSGLDVCEQHFSSHVLTNLNTPSEAQ